MKDSTKAVFKYLQENNNEDITAKALAEVLGLDAKVVNGAFTAAIQRKGYGYREEAEIKTDNGHEKVKFLKLTDAGLALDVDAVDKKED